MAKPNGKHLMVILGIGGRPGDDAGPPPRPPGAAPHAEPDMETGPGEPDADDEKLAPDKAMYHGPEEHCGNCLYFSPPNACHKVGGSIDPGGHCYVWYTPKQASQPMGPGGMPMMPMQEGQ